MKILLVEDEQSLRVLVRNVLTRLGYRVLEATTGLTAVEVWKEHRHDIKLLLNCTRFSPTGRRFGSYYGYKE